MQRRDSRLKVEYGNPEKYIDVARFRAESNRTRRLPARRVTPRNGYRQRPARQHQLLHAGARPAPSQVDSEL